MQPRCSNLRTCNHRSAYAPNLASSANYAMSSPTTFASSMSEEQRTALVKILQAAIVQPQLAVPGGLLLLRLHYDGQHEESKKESSDSSSSVPDVTDHELDGMLADRTKASNDLSAVQHSRTAKPSAVSFYNESRHGQQLKATIRTWTRFRTHLRTNRTDRPPSNKRGMLVLFLQTTKTECVTADRNLLEYDTVAADALSHIMPAIRSHLNTLRIFTYLIHIAPCRDPSSPMGAEWRWHWEADGSKWWRSWFIAPREWIR